MKSHPKIYEGRWEAQEMMKGTLIVEEGGYQDSSKEENFSIFRATFPFMCGRHCTL
jgi:hypothetical protein